LRSYTRQQLKEDKFAQAITSQVHWTVEHRNTLIIAGVVALALLAGGAYWWKQAKAKDEQASVALGSALRTYNAPLRSAGQPLPPDMKSFANAKERSEAAQKEFQKVADDYSSTRNGKYALYLSAITAMESGDSKKGEETLKKVADGSEKDLSALAKFALASLYASQNKDADAVKYYRDVIQADAHTVPKITAQLELASYYEGKNNPTEAVKIYEEIQKNEESARKAAAPKPSGDAKKPAAPEQKTPLEEMAFRKIEELKRTAR
jgi:predicted negative regulator of RcsB-dependent stress response